MSEAPQDDNCTLCRPEQLRALLAASPGLSAQWAALPRRRWPEGATLQHAGMVCDRYWLVEHGLLRSYHLTDEGVERNSVFCSEGSWVGGAGIPPFAVASPWTIQALEPTITMELHYATVQEWSARFATLPATLAEAMNHLLLRQARREAELLSLSPSARYLAFLDMHGALAPRIAQHHIASYLGISPVSLSRIRARLGMVAGRDEFKASSHPRR